MKLPIKIIERMVKETPNDMELGGKLDIILTRPNKKMMTKKNETKYSNG